MARQLFYGKISSVSPIESGSNVYVRVRGDFDTSSKTITNVVDVLGYLNIDYVRAGQTLVASGPFSSGTTVVSVDTGASTITVADFPATTVTNALARISPASGDYYIPSASLLDPQGLITFNDITGSDDSNYSNTTVYGVLGAASDGFSSQNLINGRYHKYTIKEVLYRNASGTEGSIYISWGEKDTEASSGDALYRGAAQNLAIVGLTTTESLAPMFSTRLAGLTDLPVGSDFSAFQIEVQDFFDDLVQTDIYYSGSLVSKNVETLNFTGSGVVVTSSGSTGALITITGGGGSTDTGSLLTTASVSLNTITFTKGDASTFDITVNTGSGGGSAFPYTGSALITGSLTNIGPITISGSSATSPLIINITDGNGDNNKFQVNEEGVTVLGKLDTTPTAVTGGIFYSASNEFFLGFN